MQENALVRDGATQPVDGETTAPTENVFTPALDIHETADGLVLEADLPGVPADQLAVRVEENVLHIYGKTVWPATSGARMLYEEVRPGDFYRSLILSDQVDTDRIEADFHQGVLRLTLPKAAKARPRKIEIRTPAAPGGNL